MKPIKERPILFSAPMVRAILAGRKTQTRRIIKPQPTVDQGWEEEPGWALFWKKDPNGMLPDDLAKKCRHGKTGDRLWVRETWADVHPLAIQEGRYSQEGLAGIPGPPPVYCRTIYRADGEPIVVWRREDGAHPYFTPQKNEADPLWLDDLHEGSAWRPSIHMPRSASRLTLEVTDVRVQSLQDISEEDAHDEGVEFFKTGDNLEGDLMHYYKDYMCKGLVADNDGERVEYNNHFYSAVDSFKSLWSLINGATSWAENPWVWAITFKAVKQ